MKIFSFINNFTVVIFRVIVTLILIVPTLQCIANNTDSDDFLDDLLPPNQKEIDNSEASKIIKITGAGITPFINVKLAAGFLKTAPAHVKSVFVICRWDQIEPTSGEFKFHQIFDNLISIASAKDVKIISIIWVGPQSPSWIYDNGVPLVKSSKNDWNYPYYFSEDYIFYFQRMINAYAEFIKTLLPKEQSLFISHQITEGTTGDTSPYGLGEVDNEDYTITQQDWMPFRRKVWDWYRQAFWDGEKTTLSFIFTDDANTEIDRQWQITNLPIFGVKKGQFGHGYNNNDNGERLKIWRNFIEKTEKNGGIIFARGEYDNILLSADWVKKYPVTSFYWSMLMALHTRLDYWNPAPILFEDPRMYPAMEFYNQYAGWRSQSDAPAAFSALRKALNANNTDEFPEEVYGKANRQNEDRYFAIQASFAKNGARLDDPSVMTGHAMATRRRTGKNDVGWDFIPGNFEVFLNQLYADETSMPWWNVGDEQVPYGRFARSTDHTLKKDKLYFRIDDKFVRKKTNNRFKVKIIWYDEHHGEWSFMYKQTGNKLPQVAGVIKGTGANIWKTQEFSIKDVEVSGMLEKGSDLILNHISGPDTKFHMIEIVRE